MIFVLCMIDMLTLMINGILVHLICLQICMTAFRGNKSERAKTGQMPLSQFVLAKVYR